MFFFNLITLQQKSFIFLSLFPQSDDVDDSNFQRFLQILSRNRAYLSKSRQRL